MPSPPERGLIDREDALDRAADRVLDVLVVGGGITGVGIALDAAARGLTVALVERDDLASGTSSKSSKLIHGGLRYLEQREFGLVYEAVRERNLLRHLAPHLVRPLGFAIPTGDGWRRVAVKAGLTLYDGMAAGRNLRSHQRLDAEALLEALPGLAEGCEGGGYRYYDCQTDDARLTLAVAQAARASQALIVTHAEVVDFLRFRNAVVGCSVRDRLGGASFDLAARWVVNATGVWADRVRALGPEDTSSLLTPSKGVHLTVRDRDLRLRDGAFISSGANDGRFVFVIPWGQQVIVGTTDDHYEGDLEEPSVTAPDADYLLHAVNTSFGTSLTLADVIAAWAGLRPLLRGRGDSSAPSDLSRRHAIFEEPKGLVTITGGKLTTYRRMAEELVDRIVAAEGAKNPCVTHRLPIGVRGRIEDALAALQEMARLLGLDPQLAGSLLHRHGSQAAAVVAFCAEHGETDRLTPELPYLQGEVRWAARYEMARTLDDVLQRRLRVSLRDPQAGGRAATWAAQVLAEELGWSPAERGHQLDTYFDNVARERGIVPLDASWRRVGARDGGT
ncbi:MAG: glycerol-3-phosphate dehydrogenase/oxidase [Actinomycetota bacterium]|nr:glycerol-3-phosphate dehydrogenase/oxidase [Actinomycetota bacterium]